MWVTVWLCGGYDDVRTGRSDNGVSLFFPNYVHDYYTSLPQIKLIHLGGSGAPKVVGLEDRISALKAELAKHPAPAVAG